VGGLDRAAIKSEKCGKVQVEIESFSRLNVVQVSFRGLADVGHAINISIRILNRSDLSKSLEMQFEEIQRVSKSSKKRRRRIE
jgi:hypothetical protein